MSIILQLFNTLNTLSVSVVIVDVISVNFHVKNIVSCETIRWHTMCYYNTKNCKYKSNVVI